MKLQMYLRLLNVTLDELEIMTNSDIQALVETLRNDKQENECLDLIRQALTQNQGGK